MADPVSMVMIGSMVATAAGAGIQAYGSYQGGQAQSKYYQYQAGVNNALAGVAQQNANWDFASGEVKAQQAGLVSRAAAGRETVSAGARNIGMGGSTAQVLASQHAIGAENQAVLRADAAHAAYGEEVQAAERTATAGADVFAGRTAIAAGDIGALGSIASGVGSVAGKWYTASQLSPQPSSTVFEG
jgi:hypothetical protein